MERSEELQKRMEGLKVEIEGLPETEMREIETSVELREAILTCLTAERVLRTSDPLLKTFQMRVEELREGFLARRRGLQDQLDVPRREQESLTRPLIERGIKALREVLRDVKLEESVQGPVSSGFSGPMVKILSNRSSLLKAKGLVNSGIETLKGMSLKPVAQIQAFIDERIQEIRGINFQPCSETLLETDFNRVQFLEKGVTP